MDFYGVDVGGTNLRISRVNPETGALAANPITYPMSEITTNRELTRIVFSHIPEGSHVGISAAGDVDEEDLVIRFAANSPIRGEIVFGRELREKRGCTVSETNDMNAAVQAVARYGQGKGHENVLLATYSSGFNCALSRGGKNVTVAEFGHMIYKQDGDLYCGCGGKGHLETYVSGNGAAAMAKQYINIGHLKSHPILDLSLAELNRFRAEEKRLKKKDLDDPVHYAAVLNNITAKHVYAAYSRMPDGQPQKDIRETQIRAIADSFGKMNSAYHPVDILILMGSQTLDWSVLFEPAIRLFVEDTGRLQIPSFTKPPIVRAQIKEIGIVGAVAYSLSRLE
jgi:predicted NBD/HSP70 family sugar kinase